MPYMKKFGLILLFLGLTMLTFESCLSPHDPSSYADEESFNHDSGISEKFVKKTAAESSNVIARKSVDDNYEIDIVAIDEGNSGFGYTILVDGVPKIYQMTIPSVEGNRTFSSMNKAMLAAEFVISKMKSGEFPPSINKGELDSLGVLE